MGFAKLRFSCFYLLYLFLFTWKILLPKEVRSFQQVRLFQLNCTQPTWGRVGWVIFGADMLPFIRVCPLAIVVHIAKDNLWVSPVILLQVFNLKLLTTSPLRTEVTAGDNSSLGIVVCLVVLLLPSPWQVSNWSVLLHLSLRDTNMQHILWNWHLKNYEACIAWPQKFDGR